jgi:hypothetical protein
MDPLRTKRFLLIGLAVLVVLSCNMPGLARPKDSGVGPLYTAAARTVEAQLTRVSQPPVTQAIIPTFPPPTQGTAPTSHTPTVALTNTPSPTPLPTATQAPTQPPAACDAVKFVKDVTVPDNTVIMPNAPFVKTWRLRNDGSCTWTTGYAVVFVGGDQMGAPSSTPLTENVPPGNAVDLSVAMTAPGSPGTYRANFKMRNAGGQVFGLGEDGSKPFWAQIKVAGSPQGGITYDFLANASRAEWISSVGAAAGAPVTFGGPAFDPNGAAMIQDAIVLETGATSGKVLYTLPRQQIDGVISGLFPAYSVQNGDFLRGKLGFMMNPGDGCGVGKANFQVVYMLDDGGSPKLLDEWTKSCTGSFIDVNIDLSPLAGKSVQFGLVVEALGSPTDDYAIWNSLRIEG